MGQRLIAIWKKRLAFVGMFFVLIALFVLAPYLYGLWKEPLHSYESHLSRILFSAAKGLTVFIIGLMGGCIGSFVNVVAYRMPLGLSVVANPSACPRCKSNIKGRDNIPVFGWLLLGGRCRTCRLPISARYPIVEFLFATIFLALLFCELIPAGDNLPGFKTNSRPGVSETIWFTNWKVVGLFVFHSGLMSMLATFALFKLDRNDIPVKAGLFAIACGFVAATFFPHLLPRAWMSPLPDWLSGYAASASTPLIGLVAGTIMGAAIEGVLRNVGLNPCCHKGLWLAAGLTGLCLGWQAMLMGCLIFAVLFCISRLIGGPLTDRLPILTVFCLATLIQICFWEQLERAFITLGF